MIKLIYKLTFNGFSDKLDGSTTIHCINCKTRADNI